jgi:predicted ferric reductase
MTIVWIALGVGIVGILAMRIAWPDRRDARSHLGFVSHQWLADHRVSQVSDPSGER